MTRRKTYGSWIVRQFVESERASVGDQRAEDSAPVRRVADDCSGLLVDPGGHEALEARPGRVDHAQRGILGARDERRRLDDALQDAVERELRADREAGFDERAEA